MSKYLLPHKKVGEVVVEWERLHSKSEQTESLPMFIVRKQAIYLLNRFIEYGFVLKEAKTELKKISTETLQISKSDRVR